MRRHGFGRLWCRRRRRRRGSSRRGLVGTNVGHNFVIIHDLSTKGSKGACFGQEILFGRLAIVFVTHSMVVAAATARVG